MPRRRRNTLMMLAGLVVAGLVIGGACAWVGGAAPGAFLAPLAMMAAVVPQSCGRARTLRDGALGTLFLCAGISAAWCFAAESTMMLLRATAVLTGWAGLLWALTAAMIPRPGPRRGVLRSTGVTVAAWLWLASPIWLGPAMAARGWDVPAWASTLHPLGAMNAAVIELGVWTEQPVAYALTPLGQDVAYALPRTVTPFVVAHALGAAGIVTVSLVVRRRPRRQLNSDRNDPR